MTRSHSSNVRLPHNFRRSRLLDTSGTASVAASRSRVEKSVDFKLVDDEIKVPEDGLAELKAKFNSPLDAKNSKQAQASAKS